MVVAKTYVGTSGWSYENWVGPVYPARSTPKLRYYSSIFGSVEIDSTFYAYPKPAMVQGWIKNTPPGFKFSAKLPQIITHKKRLEKVDDELKQFLDLIKPISEADKLGAILIQLPPSFTSQSQNALEDFFKLLPSQYFFAVEFRHKSWQENNTKKLLESYHVSNVITDSPLELASDITTDWAYIRYHGRGQRIWYDYRYSQDEIDKIAKKLDEIQDKTRIVYEYFNNHYGGAAVENALQLIQKTSSLSSNQLHVLNQFKQKTTDLDSFSS